MVDNPRSGKLAVILHADVVGSTALVQKDEQLAHERILETFRRFGDTITKYHGHVRELRGDALLAEFARASDAVTAALAFQAEQIEYTAQLNDSIQPIVRVGIAMGEVIIADDTVTGEGVVLAQRVEQLAKPEGICITGAIHEALPQRMPFDQEDMGEQEVKGFDERVRVYRAALKQGESIPPPQVGHQAESLPRTWGLVVAAAIVVLIVAGVAAYWFKPWAPQEESASLKHKAFPRSDKPSIAVLPFTNMSGDIEQEYFSDGISEDIITDLSRLSNLDVIARNSSFTYKGASVKVQQIGQDLGVQYVLEGSVRKAGDRLRITAQLVDTSNGHHLWAERYDRELTDVFALQDDITRQIVNALAIQLDEEEKRNLGRIATNSFEAYDSFLKGQRSYALYTEEGTGEAIELYRQAISLDPSFSRAYGALAITLIRQVELGVSDSPTEMGERALTMARKAASIDPKSPQVQWALGYIYLYRRQFNEAVEALERAISLSPGYADGYGLLALIKDSIGQAEEAVELIEKGMELNPYYSWEYLYNLGRAYYTLGEYEKAVQFLQQALERNEVAPLPRLYLAASYVQLDRLDDAEWEVTQLETLISGYTLSHLDKVLPFGDKDLHDRLFKDLRVAGLAE